ncbi:MAG: methylated-DNA--[protein]-cysteine S-methyltransferase [Muribaculaceae bacterium]|nr:methylated-DNA--[protein]-cysteine S-methyltransferase [Muribaculaceae bacterium]
MGGNEREIKVWRYASPCGRLLIGDYEGKVCLSDWDLPLRTVQVVERVSRILDAECVEGNSPLIERVIAQLEEYFEGKRSEFDLPLVMAGSDFQQRVWRELQQIPYGEAISYLQLANRIGRPRAVRAVASACRANAMSIIIPCHRVVGGNGSLTGYAGGLDAKQFLLDLERENQ